MLLVSFVAGMLVLLLSKDAVLMNALLSACIGALVGAGAELFTPGEYDTVTVPVLILAVLLLLGL